jgi:hypothetical protein
MVITDLDVVCVTICKTEADAPLRIDRDSMQTLSIPRQRVEPIARGHHQIIQTLRQMHVLGLSGSPDATLGGCFLVFFLEQSACPQKS